MKMNNCNRKLTAVFTLIIWSIQTFIPASVYAITSGPTQPEMQKFEPAGVNDMVDLFSGDFKQNIPLMDVGGYPVNLSYQSGTSMEDEASWVGMGWTLNPGAVNRNKRGLPDDFNGDENGNDKADKIQKIYSKKEFKKVGGQIIYKASLFGWEFGKASLKLNVYKDNYYGVGASFGAGLGFNTGKSSKTSLTAGLDLDVNSDVRDGVSISPSLSISQVNDKSIDNNRGSLSGGFHYNTRSGLKSIDLQASFNTSKQKRSEYCSNINLSAVHYFGQTSNPSLANNTSNEQYTFSFDLGGTYWGVHAGSGGNGYVYKEKILDKDNSTPAYGYMNYLNGVKNKNSLLDFNREKDGVFLPSTPAIPTPVATQDFFMATGQAGSQQFRPFYAGDYVVYDKAHTNTSLQLGGGVTLAGGNLQLAGGRVEVTVGSANTGKWENNNNYIDKTEAGKNSTTAFNTINTLEEPIYFKQVGEPNAAFASNTGSVPIDFAYQQNIANTNTSKVRINDRQGYSGDATTFPQLISRNNSAMITQPIKRTLRTPKNYGFSYLTAKLATLYGLDKTINNGTSSEARVNNDRKEHHISEIRVTDNEGKRMVYGIPIYNFTQEEVTFSINKPSSNLINQARKDGLVDYNPSTDASFLNNRNGRDWLYSNEKTPPYATSFLLTGVLSPDYVDVTNDGITDDDLGTAVKFKYDKIAGRANSYKWRAPYAANKANYNEGFLSDPKDDKASYVYGEKELWYMNSIESKTMIAIFKTSNREDGLGVTGANGGQSAGVKLKKLDRIELYSKADYYANANPTPIKVVNFEYDYSLYPGIPNSTVANGGKLTLKKVYFTFGGNLRGQSNPYEFFYDNDLIQQTVTGLPSNTNSPEVNDWYAPRQEDRWGAFKQGYYNRLVPNASGNGFEAVLNNSEFPYSLQENDNNAFRPNYNERLLADRYASKWQLVKIITPTSSIINVDYESDDYAFVQNKMAMQMCFLKCSNIANAIEDNFINAGYQFKVELPKKALNKVEFLKKYLADQSSIFYKAFVDIDGRGHYEYVHGYAEINFDLCDISNDGWTGFIALKPIDGVNPVAKNAWQLLRTDLPQYAYDNYDNSDVGDGIAAIKSIVQALGNLREFTQSFDTKAKNKKFANKIDLSKSMVRLVSPNRKKIGGGSRVRKITISDDWASMINISSAETATYGQEYSYTTIDSDFKDTNGQPSVISSGVAAYEPQIGNEENPFHEPLNFTEKVFWGNDKYHTIEKPFCESYFPAAQVGYSKVTVKSIGSDNTNETGYIDNEFYTAKDFPTLVDNTTLDQTNYENSLILKLFSCTSIKRVATSQGFKVELNDMHGKPKSVKVFNKGGDMLSSSEYFYSVKDQNASIKELDNQADLLLPNGTIALKQTMGTDFDIITDVRESKNESFGTSIGVYQGTMIIPLFPSPIPLPYGAVLPIPSIIKDSYNSICTVKIIQRYGVLKKVRTTQNGSTTEAENLLWDGETGEVLLTKNQTEFDTYTYAFHYPAYMVNDYEGMGGAYKNLGAKVNLAFSGDIISTGSACLFPGDELIKTDVTAGNNVYAWVVKTNNSLKLINKDGNFITAAGYYSIIRSGRRNLLNASAGTVVCMNNPIVGNTIDLGVDKKILDSKAVLYNQEWGVPNYCSSFTEVNSQITGGGNLFGDYEYPDIFNIHLENYSGQIITFAYNASTPQVGGGLEVYVCSNNNYNTIANFNIPLSTTTNASGSVTFSFNHIPNGDDLHIYVFNTNYSYGLLFNYTLSYNSSSLPVNYLNPYYKGLLGNWRPQTNYVYAVNREQNSGLQSQKGGTDIKNSGAYSSYNAFWNFSNNTLARNTGDPRWVWSNKSIYFDQKGNEVESVDALNRFGSALFGYQQSIATAVAANARHNEIAFDGFEDYKFSLKPSGTSAESCPAKRHLDFGIAYTNGVYKDAAGNTIDATDAHSGKYSLKLTSSPLTITRKFGSATVPTTSLLGFDSTWRYVLNNNEQADGFSPVKAKKQLLSLWVKDNSPSTNNINNLTITLNGTASSSTGTTTVFSASGMLTGASTALIVPVVEGWKRLEIPVNIPVGATDFTLKFFGNVNIDDIRLQPYDAHLNTYVFDDTNLRLLSQLDENNFATFYEYDEEGTPIRVKKETERGIMTLKENRKAFRKR